jgi:hypothetical protein
MTSGAGQPENLTRIVVQGSINTPRELTRLTVDPLRSWRVLL